MADVLADFDPVRSREILDTCSHKEITEVWISRKVTYSIDEDNNGN